MALSIGQVWLLFYPQPNRSSKTSMTQKYQSQSFDHDGNKVHPRVLSPVANASGHGDQRHDPDTLDKRHALPPVGAHPSSIGCY